MRTLPSLPLHLTAAAALGSLLAATGWAEPATTTTKATAKAALVDAAGKTTGEARLADTPDGVEISIEIRGLTPGKHGFHVHEKGSCEAGPDPQGATVAFGAAGAHFDPLHTEHHGQPLAPATQTHAGDLPNLVADDKGVATLTIVSPRMTVTPGPTSILGRALVVHEKGDDYVGNPAGNSGARVACGRIEPAPVAAAMLQTAQPAGRGKLFPKGML